VWPDNAKRDSRTDAHAAAGKIRSEDIRQEKGTMMSKGMRQTTTWVFLVAFSTAIAGCAEPLSKREQGGLAGAGLGAASGAIIGSTVGRAGAGALIGEPIGLLAGALIGDQLMA
jgi:hypothetical protein